MLRVAADGARRFVKQEAKATAVSVQDARSMATAHLYDILEGLLAASSDQGRLGGGLLTAQYQQSDEIARHRGRFQVRSFRTWDFGDRCAFHGHTRSFAHDHERFQDSKDRNG